MVIIKESKIHGKGAFASERIISGTILECDVLEVSKSRVVDDYIFPFIGDRVCIHIGFASFLNSSKNPNVKHLKIDISNMKSYFEAVSDIEVDEEITLNYI